MPSTVEVPCQQVGVVDRLSGRVEWVDASPIGLDERTVSLDVVPDGVDERVWAGLVAGLRAKGWLVQADATLAFMRSARESGQQVTSPPWSPSFAPTLVSFQFFEATSPAQHLPGSYDTNTAARWALVRVAPIDLPVGWHARLFIEGRAVAATRGREWALESSARLRRAMEKQAMETSRFEPTVRELAFANWLAARSAS